MRRLTLGVMVALAGLTACTYPDVPFIDAGEVDGPPPDADIDAGPMSRLTVVRSGAGSLGGTVTSAPDGIDCGSVCTFDFPTGTTITLTRAVDAGTVFDGWTGPCTGTDPTCTFELTSDMQAGAVFAVAQHTITVAPAGNGAGVVTSNVGGINCGAMCEVVLDHGQQITLTATPTGASTFAGWTDVGCTGTAPCTFTVTQDATITAAFALDYTLTVSRNGNGHGTVTSSPPGIACGADCDQVYPASTMVTLTATPDADSTFIGWTGGNCTGTGTCTVTIDAVVAVAAEFRLRRYPLTVSRAGTGGGAVSSSPAGIDCGSDCTEDYDHGQQITLTATANATSTFTGWSDPGCTGTAPCVVTITAARSVSATFAANLYPVTVNRTGPGAQLGTITSTPPGINCGSDCTEMYSAGSMVTLTAAAMSGATFAGWSGGGCTGTGVCTVTVGGATSVDAMFTLNGYTLAVSKAGSGSALGTITSTPMGISCGIDCTEVYTFGQSITLSAAAQAGATFTGWSGGGCSGVGACITTINGDTAITATFTLDSYTLAVVRAGNAASSGTVTSAPSGITCSPAMNDCDQSYVFDTMVTLTAAPGAGSTFGGWSGGGCAGTGSCVVTMNAAKTVTATFTLDEALTVTRAGNGAGFGTVTSTPAGINCGNDCSENFGIGTMVTLTASATGGATFTGWSGACSGTQAMCTVTVAAATNAVATFTLNQYTLTAVRGGDGAGTIESTPGGIACGSDCTEAYDHGTMVTLTASPDPGSTFTGWSGGGCSGTGTCVVTLNAAATVTATFAADRVLTVTTAGNGTGSVTSVPGGITCQADCTETYPHGTSVTLTAAAVTGSTFTGWSGGGCSGTGTCVVSMTVARNVQATFTLTTHVLTVARNGSGTGTVTSVPAGINCGPDCAETVNYGTMLTLTAAESATSTFTGWSGGGCAGTGTCVVTVNAATTVTATFEADQVLTVALAGGGSAYGAVSSSPAGITCGADCSEAYPYGTTVTITATPTPAAAATFDGWSGAGGCTGTAPCTLSMTAARAATATFTRRQYTLTAAKNGTGAGTVTGTVSGPTVINCGADCSETVDYGTMVTLTATPSAGSTFTAWSGGGCTGTAPCTTTVTAAATVTATFTLQQFTLTVAKAGDGGGTVASNPVGITCGADCAEPYNHNTAVLLTPTAAAGSTFTGWSGGGCSGTGNCTVTVTADTTVTATFQANRTLTVTFGSNGAGTVSSSPAGISCPGTCSQVYAHGQSVMLTAAQSTGSTFAGWGGACSGTGTCTVLMDQARNVTANFTLTTHTLTVSRAGTGANSGTVTSSPSGINCGADCTETVNYGTSLTLTASAAAGATFTGWSGGGCSGAGSCVTTINAATTVTATFELDQTLSISVAGTGSAYGLVTSSPAGISCGADCSEAYTYGQSVTITAGVSPSGAATFTGWSGGGCSGTSPCTVSMTAARSVTATYAIASHTLTVSRLGAGMGTVSSTPAGIDCGNDCAEGYTHGTAVALSAAAQAGSSFAGWAGACTGTGACNVTMDQAKAVMATFNLNSYTVTAARTTDGAVSGTVTSVPSGINCPGDCSEGYVSGTAVTLTATAAAGATFAGWTSGSCSGTGDCNFTVTGNALVTADFRVHKTLSVSRSGAGSGTVATMVGNTINCGNDCTEDYVHGTMVTLVATPNTTTSNFGGWSGGGCSGTLLTCTVTMDQARSVTADFPLKTYTLTTAKAGFGGGTITSSPAGAISCGADCTETVAHGGMITLVATPNAGDIFFGWSGGGCSGTGNCVTTVTAATTVTATFDQCNRTTAEVCTGGAYEACSAQGQSTATMTCPLGCSTNPPNKCVDVNPSNGLASYLDMAPAGPDVTFGANSTIHTGSGNACNGASCDAFGTPPGPIPSVVVGTMRVYMVRSLNITGAVKVSGTNSLVFLVHGDVNITGTLDVSADQTLPGPGAITGTNACHGGDGVIRNPSPGGGGGGRAGFGSAGGVSGSQAGGGSGQNIQDSTLIPLRGGCRGGAAQEEFNSLLRVAAGGAGGGAVQIVSRGTIRVSGAGVIDVSGGGGWYDSHSMGGGGGGSGGGILLEAPFVIVDGTQAILSAKGGGGAGASQSTQGAPGQDGGTGPGNAAGGQVSSLPMGGRGGNESLGSTAGTGGTGDTGGGGGSVGLAVVRTASGSFNPGNGAAVRASLNVHAVQTRLVP